MNEIYEYADDFVMLLCGMFLSIMSEIMWKEGTCGLQYANQIRADIIHPQGTYLSSVKYSLAILDPKLNMFRGAAQPPFPRRRPL